MNDRDWMDLGDYISGLLPVAFESKDCNALAEAFKASGGAKTLVGLALLAKAAEETAKNFSNDTLVKLLIDPKRLAEIDEMFVKKCRSQEKTLRPIVAKQVA